MKVYFHAIKKNGDLGDQITWQDLTSPPRIGDAVYYNGLYRVKDVLWEPGSVTIRMQPESS